MITRIVKMTFREDKVDAFKALFYQNCVAITASAGCRSVNLFTDAAHSATFFTISQWGSLDDLNTYRNSQLFNEVWQKTKAMFSEKPEAWSLTEEKR